MLKNDELRVGIEPVGATAAVYAGDLCLGKDGKIVGRYANRIKQGRFTLGGVEYRLPLNEGQNTLHGGFKGFGNREWTGKAEAENSVRFSLFSDDGDEGFPGDPSYAQSNRTALYREELSGVEGLELPPDKAGHAYHLFPIQVKEELRGPLFKHLWERNIHLQIHYRPVDRKSVV